MKLSACTIVKNEEKNIARSIESYKAVVNEIIIVDTGSTDNTVEICKSLGAKVFHFDWINDFSAAKNFALEHATGDWIIFLDADEWFVPKLVDNRLANIIKRVEKLKDIGLIKTTLCNIDERTNFIASKVYAGRIFRNGAKIRFQGKIHEEVRNDGLPLKPINLEELEIYHSGYQSSVMGDKAKRNLEILYDVYRKGQATTGTYFYLCRENIITGNYKEGLKFYELFFRQKDAGDLLNAANVYVGIYENGIIAKQNCLDKYTYNDIMKDVAEAIEKYPELPKHYYLKGLMEYIIDDDAALESFNQALKLHKDYKNRFMNTFAFSLPDAYCKMAQIYRSRHMTEKAFDHYVLALREFNKKDEPFIDLIPLIRNQKDEEIIFFLNSLYDVKKKEDIEFLSKQLMLTRLHKVFLYYALKYNKEFDGQDETTYAAMILSNNEEFAVETALTAFYNAGKETDRLFAAIAVICKKRLDLFNKYKSVLNPAASSIINKYFKGKKCVKPTSDEKSAFLQLYPYVFYMTSRNDIKAFEELFEEMPVDVASVIIGYYLKYRDYFETIEVSQRFLETQKSESFKIQMKKILGIMYYFIEDYNKSIAYLTEVLSSSHLDMDANIIKHLKYICSLSGDETVKEAATEFYDTYSPLFREYIDINEMVRTGQVSDTATEDDLNVVRHIRQDEFYAMTVPAAEKLSEVFLGNLFNLCEKALEKGFDILAFKTITRLLKNGYRKDILYFRLGEIFTRQKNAGMSLYCHNKAFEENATLAETLIPDQKNENRHYICRCVECQNIVECPLCGSSSRLHSVYNTVISSDFSPQYPSVKVWRYCDECNHMFAAYIPKELGFEMEDSMAESAIKSVTGNVIKYAESIHNIRALACGNKLLDVGCGNGSLIAAALEYGFEVCGVEPVKNLAGLCAKKLDVTIYNTVFEEFETMEKFDVVSMGCVLESFALPIEAVKKAYVLLNEQGLLYIETPNFLSGYARSMKDKSWTLRSGRIANYFSVNSLYHMLNACNFQPVYYGMSERNPGYMEVIASKSY